MSKLCLGDIPLLGEIRPYRIEGISIFRQVCPAILELVGMDVGRTDWISYPTDFGVAHAVRKSTSLVEHVDVTWTSFNIYLVFTGIFFLFECQSCLLDVPSSNSVYL